MGQLRDIAGRVIGKRGATAQSLRTLLRALGTKNDARYNLKIIDNGPEDRVRPERTDQPAAAASSPAPKSDDAPADDTAISDEVAEPAEEPKPEPIVEAEPEAQPEDQTSDRLAQTRSELADLDDLDI